VPYARDECNADLTFIDYSKEGRPQPAQLEPPAPAKPWWKFWD